MNSRIKRITVGMISAVTLIASGGVVAFAASSTDSDLAYQTIDMSEYSTDELGNILNKQASSSTKTEVLELYEDLLDADDDIDNARIKLILGLIKRGVIVSYNDDGSINIEDVEESISNLNSSYAISVLTELLENYTDALADEENTAEDLVDAMEDAGYDTITFEDYDELRDYIATTDAADDDELLSLIDELEEIAWAGNIAVNNASSGEERHELFEEYSTEFEEACNELQKTLDGYGLDITIAAEWYE